MLREGWCSVFGSSLSRVRRLLGSGSDIGRPDSSTVESGPAVALGAVAALTAHQDAGNLRDNHDMWPPFYDWGASTPPEEASPEDDQ